MKRIHILTVLLMVCALAWAANEFTSTNITGDLSVTGTTTLATLELADIEADNLTMTEGEGVIYPANGTVTAPSIRYTEGECEGIYYSPEGEEGISFTIDGVREGLINVGGWNGDIIAPLGAFGTPSISFLNDSNTGLYSAGADTINLTTGGTLRLSLNTASLTSTLPYLAANGSAAAPSFDFSGDAGNGMYLSAANTPAWASDGTLRLSLSTTALTTTLPVVGPVGSASAPSYTWTGDLNTGMYHPNNEQIAFATSGTLRTALYDNYLLHTTYMYSQGGNTAATPNYQTGTTGVAGLYGAADGSTLGLSILTNPIVTWSATTQEWVVTQYNDANVGSLVLQTGGTLPGIVEILDNDGDATGIYTRGFAVGEQGSGSIEIPHDYKEGTNLTFHIHFGINDAPSGTDYIKWNLIYTVAHNGDTLVDATTVPVETPVDTQYKSYRSDFTAITGTSFDIGDQFVFTIARDTAAGDAFGGEALVHTIGFHYISSTLGSASISSK